MKHLINISMILALALPLACQKTPTDGPETAGPEIILQVDNQMDAVVTTKAISPVGSIPSSLFWGATTGGNAAGSSNETEKWNATSAGVSTGKINTGKYQSATPTTYNYYVSNVSFSVGANTTLTATGGKASTSSGIDVICGRGAQTSSSTPSVELNHIFARTGNFTMNTQEGYEITVNSWTIASNGAVTGTAGTYSLRSGTWTSSSASLGTTTISSGDDYYLIPGSYTVTCNYTLTKGGVGEYSQTFTKSANVTLIGGKINHITGTASGGSASQIVISVTLNDWDEQTLTPSFS